MVFGKRRTSPLPAVVLLFALSMVCMGTFVVIVDELCHTNITNRQPIYPGAEIVEQDHNFLRPRASGTSSTVLYTPDDRETVRQWMRDVTLDLLDREQFHGIATVQWQAEDNPEGDGSLIYLYSECVQ